MTTQKKNSRLSALAILCQMFCLLMALTVALPSIAMGDAKNGYAYVVILELLATVAAAIAAVYAARAARRSNDAADRTAEAAEGSLQHEKELTSMKLVADTLIRIVGDEEVRGLVDKVHEKGTEIKAGWKETREILDKLLSQFAIVAHARERGMVNDDDLCTILYDLLQIINSESIRCHMDNHLLLMEQKSPTLHKHPYRMLVELVDYLFPNGKGQGDRR